MPLISEQEIATDNGMWLIYPSHLEKVLDCQKKEEEKIKQSSSSRAKAKIFNILNKPNFAADATSSMRNWCLHETFKFLYRLMLVKS